LWTCPVTPRAQKLFVESVGVYDYAQTALAFAATNFYYWRGTIKFHFQLSNATAFDRGKFLIFYEPNIPQHALINADLGTHKQFIQIVDIQETQDIEICVEWAFPKAWAKVTADGQILDLGQSTCLDNVGLIDCANGYIGIVPFTNLQNPTSEPMEVNVFISSDDMAFNQFTDIKWNTRRPVVLIPEDEKIELQSEAMPYEVTCVSINNSTASTDNISLQHFGEMPISFRALCKRYTSFYPGTGYLITADGVEPGISLLYEQNLYTEFFPPYGGVLWAKPFHLMDYLRPAFLGMRGGVKHRVQITGEGTFIRTMAVAKTTLNQPALLDLVPRARFLAQASRAAARAIGTVSDIPATNGGVEFEIPFYSNNLFVLAFNQALTPTDCTLFEQAFTRSFNTFISVNSNGENAAYVTDDKAAGEDFTLMRFQGAPFARYVP